MVHDLAAKAGKMMVANHPQSSAPPAAAITVTSNWEDNAIGPDRRTVCYSVSTLFFQPNDLCP